MAKAHAIQRSRRSIRRASLIAARRATRSRRRQTQLHICSRWRRFGLDLCGAWKSPTRVRRAVALGAGALLAMPAIAHAQAPSSAPYEIPTQTTGVSLPLVAALTLPRDQTLGQVLRKGLRVRLV